MSETSSFEQQIEVDLRRLAEEVEQRRGSAAAAERPGDKELIRQAIQSITDDAAASRTGAAGGPLSSAGRAGATVIQNPLPDYAQSAPAETKLEIEYLLELAFKKGPFLASREAKKSSSFVQDAFRDALAGKLYEILKSRNLIA